MTFLAFLLRVRCEDCFFNPLPLSQIFSQIPSIGSDDVDVPKALKLFNQANNRGEVVTNVSLGVTAFYHDHVDVGGSLWNVYVDVCGRKLGEKGFDAMYPQIVQFTYR